MDKIKDLEKVNFRLQRDNKKLSVSAVNRYDKYLWAIIPPAVLTALSSFAIGVAGSIKLPAIGASVLETFSIDESIKIVNNATSFIPRLEQVATGLAIVSLGVFGIATAIYAKDCLKIKAGEKGRTEAGISLIKDMKTMENLPEDGKDAGLNLANRLFEDEEVSNLSLRDKTTLIKLLGTYREGILGETVSVKLRESYDKVISFLERKKSLAGSATVKELVESHLALRLSSRRRPYCGCKPIK